MISLKGLLKGEYLMVHAQQEHWGLYLVGFLCRLVFFSVFLSSKLLGGSLIDTSSASVFLSL